MNLTLTPELEVALREAASQRGTTPELLALDCLQQSFVLPSSPQSNHHGSLADFLRDHIGVLNSADKIPGGANMSQDAGKKFAAGLLERRAHQIP